ncbi:zf-C3HC4 domain-containing protein/WD40 domain-containing protein/SecA_PP_bind domain-containing protein/SecA_SW domain-containing protein/SecA_DEAD domain-containing protein, partial [Cephalotus follicularis]
ELPECPVCLQYYDGEYTIPRVLACGHTACEVCIAKLPQKYPHTVRCPACTQLVKYPQNGPSFLPKNIDLLRLVNPDVVQKPHKETRNDNQVPDHHPHLLPPFWSNEFYTNWKQWVLPKDAVLVDVKCEGGSDEGLCSGQGVKLFKVGSFLNESDNDVFKFGYLVRVFKCLSEMREEEREELGFILKVFCFRKIRFCAGVFGLWGDLESGFLYLVCERLNGSNLENLNGLSKDGLFSFVLMGMEICEAVINLHKEGLIAGCLGILCFKVDSFGHVYVDLGEVLVVGRKVHKIVVEAGFGERRIENKDIRLLVGDLMKSEGFASPDVMFEVLNKEGIQVECGGSCEYSVGYSADVWSLACVLLRLFIGKQFNEETVDCVLNDLEKGNTSLEDKLGEEFVPLQRILCQCLKSDPRSRPLVTDVWKCLREMVIRPQFDNLVKLGDEAVSEESKGYCLVLGEVCRMHKEILKKRVKGESQGTEDGDLGGVGETRVDRDLIEGFSEGNVKSKDMLGHLGCITGLAVGGKKFNKALSLKAGGFLFSCSMDKSVRVWSLKDFSHVQTFKGHEHKVTTVVYVDVEEPLCISADGGGGIFVWSMSLPLGQEPFKKWYEENDWRYSGIHALTTAGNGYLYTGSGDKTIKAWSLQDATLSCTMSGHKSVVSTLAVCNGVLYSGSWDGTIRLWTLSDHSLLTVLGEDTPGIVFSVLSLNVDQQMLVAAHEDGSIKVWRNDMLVKCTKIHTGCIFAVDMDGKWLFTGGWDKTVNVLENLGRVSKSWSDMTSLNNWVVRDYYRLVDSVNSFEPLIQSLSDEQLTAKTAEFRQRLGRGETLGDIQAEAFAVVREAAIRKLGMRHFDVQIIGGAVLHDGSIAEMRTGEGKTLVSTLAAYLNALSGEGVHVVTVNDYLAQRDAEWMGRLHRFLGLSVGLIQRGMTAEERRSNYGCNITYTNNSELGFDYLRDNLAGNSVQLVMRWPKPFHFAIVDEVDSVLIDEGRNPLLISGEASKDAARYPVAAKVAELLLRGLHYNVELKDNSVELTEEGIVLSEMALETNDLWDENDPWARFVMNALKAKEFYRRDVQYIVRNGKALIINELTGRVEEKRRWSEGIHQSVEAKEGLKIQADSVVVAQITYQSLFKLYPKLSGMTGTAKTEEKEFLKMFQMPVIEVPTNLPNIRKDLPIQAFATAQGKWEYVRQEVECMFQQGRPVLVGTTSVENSEYLSDLLKERKIPHSVLNARPKYAAREAETVAQAGRKYAITISTNMAGRGTDIILGGNPKVEEIIEDSLLAFLTQEAPNVEVDAKTSSQKALSKIKVGPSSLALLAKTALMAKYVGKSEGKSWTYQEAKSMIAESVEMSQSVDLKELQKLIDEQFEMYPLGPAIALAYLSILKDCELHCSNEGAEVKRLGGLHVIGTSLHESRRIDNQLRGRAGRQGDPGSTRFMVSLQDEMFQKFNFDTEWAVRLISKINNDEDIPIEGGAIVRQLLALQINAEKYFFNIRKSLVEFDEVLEVQRKHVYDLRQLILMGDNGSCSQHISQYMQAVVDEIVFKTVDPLKHPRFWSLGKLLHEFVTVGGKLLEDSFVRISEEALLKSLAPLHEWTSIDIDNFHLPNLPKPPYAFRGIHRKRSSLKRWLAICSDDLTKNGKYRPTTNLLRKYLGDFLIASYIDVVQKSGYDHAYIKDIERAVLVKTLDCFWRDHLVNMNRLSSSVNVRSFGHRNPLEEYKIDGCRFFISMLSATRRLTVESLMQYWSSPMESQELYV